MTQSIFMADWFEQKRKFMTRKMKLRGHTKQLRRNTTFQGKCPLFPRLALDSILSSQTFDIRFCICYLIFSLANLPTVLHVLCAMEHKLSHGFTEAAFITVSARYILHRCVHCFTLTFDLTLPLCIHMASNHK